MSSSHLFVGVAGWEFPHWHGVVYPKPSPRGFHPLDFLADRVDAVEITSTFYRSPRPELVRLWAAKTAHNGSFRFTARLHRAFTHERNLDAKHVKEFIQALDQLGDRLGCLLMQFPYAFRFTEENKDFLIRLRRAFHMFPLVAELRHSSWTCPEGMGTLIDYHVGFANLDQPQKHGATAPGSYLTSAVGYVKLHGRECGAAHEMYDDREERATGNRYLYTLVELTEWKSRVEHLRRFAENCYVVFNNDGAGKSVVNALQMQGLLSGCETLQEAARSAAGARSPRPHLFSRTAA